MNNIALAAVKQVADSIKENPHLGILKCGVNLNWQDGTLNNVLIRDFSPIVIDEPSQLGGRNKGANPVEHLLTAVVSCFAITFEVFASQEGIKLEKVAVAIDADLDLAVFLAIKEGKRGIINPVIKLNAVTSASKEKIREIANLALAVSPVLNSIKAKVKLVIE